MHPLAPAFEQFSRIARVLAGRFCLRMGPIPGAGKIAKGLPLSFSDRYLGSDHLWRSAGNEACDAARHADFSAFEALLDSGIPICGTHATGGLSVVSKSLDALRSGAAPRRLAAKLAGAKISPLWQPDGSVFPREAFEALALSPDPLGLVADSPSARLNLRSFSRDLAAPARFHFDDAPSFEAVSFAKGLFDSGAAAASLSRLLLADEPKLSKLFSGPDSAPIAACLLMAAAASPKAPSEAFLQVLSSMDGSRAADSFLDLAPRFTVGCDFECDPTLNPKGLLTCLRALGSEAAFSDALREAAAGGWPSFAAPLLSELERLEIDDASAPARPSSRLSQSL